MKNFIVPRLKTGTWQSGPDPVEAKKATRSLLEKTGAAVVPAFVLRAGPGSYQGLILPAVSMAQTRDREADLRRNTSALARVVEDVIRRYPDQWYNFDPVWSTR
jgi:Kdo2-lipid IVA lauroyltransferase/acyltransferase